MTILDRRLPSSTLLPTYPQDFDGCRILCAERGVDYYTAWESTGGAWQPVGPSYVGAYSGAPAASKVRQGTRIIVSESPPVGLTRAPTLGAKMKRTELVATVGRDNSTQVYYPRDASVPWRAAGTQANPCCANFTAGTGTNLLAEIALAPANFLNQIDLEVFWRIQIGRVTTATATADAALTFGPTLGSTGNTVIDAVTVLAASVNSVAWLEGSMWIRTSASQNVTYTNAPQSKANVAGQASTTVDLTAANVFSIVINNATANDIFNVESFSIGIR